uniref:Uncharacterized protein n=1 Tax=Anguilla anguilla TaxID=7936 RepID=A0A0E9RX63_ANGAN
MMTRSSDVVRKLTKF